MAFLFTDIEGSSALREADRAGMIDEAIAARNEAIAIATSIGPEADFDHLEALYQWVFASAATGTRDVAGR